MLFNSTPYFFFFLAVLLGAILLRQRLTTRTIFLLLASYVFYASNNGWLLTLILASTCIDYAAGLWIAQSKSQRGRKAALITSVATNLGILGYFKYIDFFRETVAAGASALGLNLGWVDLNILLPVGISFYTFQSMSYTIDVYRGTIPVERSWFRFAFYVAYFPQLVAGPIMRASYFLPQVEKVHKLSIDDVEAGVFLICRGLFKKIVIADFLAIYADYAFGLGAGVSAVDLWIGLYAFTLQIYFDFSGYTDIALGCSRLLGYRIPENFMRPYAALGFSDFWQRWHISLSSWLRDYLYISLGGNRQGHWKTYRNLMLTMLLGGLWHGAGWQFVLWGFMHGTYLCIERWLGLAKSVPDSLTRRTIKRLIIFHCVVLTWLPFRAESLSDVIEYLQRMVQFHSDFLINTGMVGVVLVTIATLAMQWYTDEVERHELTAIDWIKGRLFISKAAVYGIAATVIVIANAKGAQPFIYFQF